MIKKDFHNAESWKVTIILLSLGIVMFTALIVPVLAGYTGTIIVNVADANSKQPIRTGATVTVTETFGQGSYTCTTDYDGKCTIVVTLCPNCDNDAYDVKASAQGYYLFGVSVTVNPGGTANANLALTPVSASASTGQIRVTVTDAYTNKPIGGATVAVRGITCSTDYYDGACTIEITSGTYTASASASGYNSGSTTVVISPGGTGGINLPLKPAPPPQAPPEQGGSAPVVTTTAPGFDIFEAIAVLAILIVGISIQQRKR